MKSKVRMSNERAISLRIAGADDEPVVRLLAELDEAPVPDGDVLLGLVENEPVAALSLRDGHVVANPFLPSEATVVLLRLRAHHLSQAGPRRRGHSRLGLRLRPRFI
jgi:hypothetical protein